MRFVIIFLLAVFVVAMLLAFVGGRIGQALETRLFPDENATPVPGGGADIGGSQVE